MEWSTATTLARAGVAAYSNRHIIQEYWTKAKAKFDIGDTQILVTGLPSAGKTILVGQMHGRARSMYYDDPGESTSVEVDAVSFGEWAKLIRVLPGQLGYRTAGEISEYHENASLEGIIHVVNFGYSTPRDRAVQISWAQVDGIDTIDKLRQVNLKLEIDGLRHELQNIRKSLHLAQRPKWLLIAVNKVDLFSGALDQALLHYHPAGSSDFSKELRLFQSEVGAANFGVYVAQTCADPKEFEWNSKIVSSSLRPQQQTEVLRDFVKTIALISKKHDV